MNPHPEFIYDEASGIEVDNPEWVAFDLGFKLGELSGMGQALDILKKAEKKLKGGTK